MCEGRPDRGSGGQERFEAVRALFVFVPGVQRPTALPPPPTPPKHFLPPDSSLATLPSSLFPPTLAHVHTSQPGNICPGMNDTIEAMVKRLGDYGVPEENVMGIR